MRERGFTLIELVIVVAIVGLLASAAMPLARWSVKRSKEYQLQQNLRILRTAIDRYHDAAAAGLIEVPEGSSGYPPSLDALVEGVPLLGQMPPVMPGVADEYAATGAGLTGGLGAQLRAADPASSTGAASGAGTSALVPAASPGNTAAGSRVGSRSLLGGGATTGAQPDTGAAAGSSRFLGTGRGRAAVGTTDTAAQDGSGAAGGSVFDRLQSRAVGQLATDATEPLIGPDGQPVRVMFLRRIPIDPMTGTAEWGVRCYGEPPSDRLWCGRDVFDVYSKAFSDAIDGTKYRDW
jgi:prepilin-type N-terminal cleavage/methylation domain-containing protein